MKKILASALSVIMLANMMVSTAMTAVADEQERYPYAMYSSGDITLNSQSVSINGDVYLNGTYSTLCAYPNINGTISAPPISFEDETTEELLISDILDEDFGTSSGVTTPPAVDVTIDIPEETREEMLFLHNKVTAEYFSDNCVSTDKAYTSEEMNIHVNSPVFAKDGVSLNGSVCLNKSIGTLSDISIDGNNLNGNSSAIYSKYGDITINSDSFGMSGLIYAPFGDVVIESQNFNLNGVIIAKSITITASNINVNYDYNVAVKVGYTDEGFEIPYDEWNYLPDSDDDTLPDVYEEEIDTDPTNPDTDGDMLRDDYELMSTGTDPTLYDTDENGVSDGDEDFDSDGLTNYDEYLNGTNPYMSDTDGDDLNDSDEVNVHLTDPLDSDTDNDDVIDGDELILGIDPTLYDTDYDGTYDGAERFAQTYIYEVEDEECAVTEIQIDFADATNYVYRTTGVENLMGIDYLSSNVVGLIGAPFEIETTSSFTSAVLSYKVNPKLLGETEIDNLMFLWYDEENGVYVELETVTDEENNTVSTNVTHFSQYMIVNSIEWFDAWKNAPVYDSGIAGGYSSIDTVLTLDFSGSMSTSEKTMAKRAALTYIETMKPGDKVAIVTYGNYATVELELTDDINALKACLNGYLSSDGGTSFTSAVNVSANVLSKSTASNKNIILMSDGQSTISDSTLNNLDYDIIIHTIGLQTGSYDSVLRDIASKTGGQYFKAASASELFDIYSNIGLTNNDIGEDTDGDGLADIFEISGMMLTNGRVIFTDPLKADTDGDMLVDGDEIIIFKNFKELITEAYPIPKYAYVFDVKSDPFAGDFSNSGKSDYDRANETDIYGESRFVSALYGDIISIPVGTVAYGYPSLKCGEAFITKETNQNYQYRAGALIYANNEHWIMINSGDFYEVWGYILCDENQYEFLNQHFKSTVIKIEKDKYSDGEYASSTGEGCVCHGFCNWDTGADGGCTCFSYENSIQCEAFAKYVFNNVTGKSQDGWTRSIDLSEAKKAIEFIKDVPNCSYFRSSSIGHSFIVVSHTETDVTIYHCNFRGYLDSSQSSKCIVQYSTISYEDFSRWFGIVCGYTPSIANYKSNVGG